VNFLLTDATNCDSKPLEQPVYILQKIKNARWALGVSFKFSTRSDAISKKLHIIDFIHHYLMHQISYLSTTLWGSKTKERNYSKHPGLRTIFF